jgi:hypothetical protein
MAELSEFQVYDAIVDFEEIRPVEEDITQKPYSTVLYFGKGFESTRWNREVLMRIAMAIYERCKKDGGWQLESVPVEYIHRDLYVQLRQARGYWKEIQPRDGENQDDADSRVINARAVHNQKALSALHRTRVRGGNNFYE